MNDNPGWRNETGRLFHIVGPKTEKLREPATNFVDGITKEFESFERN